MSPSLAGNFGEELSGGRGACITHVDTQNQCKNNVSANIQHFKEC